MSLLVELKTRLSITDDSQDELLTSLLSDSAKIICRRRLSKIVEEQYLDVQLRIAVSLYNKVGAEGEVMHIEGAITRSYDSTDVPKALLAEITPKAKVRL